MQENVIEPVVGIFPDLSSFIVILQGDNRFFLGAGLLADGLIVPLFPDEASAEEVINSLAEDHRGMQLKVSKLGDPFKAMRKSAGEGATGFQFSPGMFTGEHRKSVFAITQGRVLFPFMVRHSECGSQWPTVLGSARLCNAGVYLTRSGAVNFGPHELMQWIRWDVMDRASAKLSDIQPLRSHDPGEPFWCLSHAEGDVRFSDGKSWYAPEGSAVVLFAADVALRMFMPPEGYYPVFTSKEAGEEFLSRRLGGAFHILSLGKMDIPNLVQHQGVMAQDLGPKGALGASMVRVDNLAKHLVDVQKKFSMPPFGAFVINPAGHREDVAWGRFGWVREGGVELKSVGVTWELMEGHKYKNLSRNEQFTGNDTFFLGPLDFDCSELSRSLSHFDLVINGEDLRAMTSVEVSEIIRETIIVHSERRSEELWALGMGSPVDTAGTNDDSGEDPDPETQLQLHLPFLAKWVLNLWDTVDGERLGPLYFDTPFQLARGLCALELEDRPARVNGRNGHGAVGFDGSRNAALEDAQGQGLANALSDISACATDLTA